MKETVFSFLNLPFTSLGPAPAADNLPVHEKDKDDALREVLQQALSPLSALGTKFDEQLMEYLSKGFVLVEADRSRVLGLMKRVGDIIKTEDDLFVISSPPSQSEIPVELNESLQKAWDMYYMYWADQQVRLENKAQGIDVLQSLEYYDRWRIHFDALLECWNETPKLPAPQDLTKLARRIAGNCFQVLSMRHLPGYLLDLSQRLSQCCDPSDPESYVRAKIDYLERADHSQYNLEESIQQGEDLICFAKSSLGPSHPTVGKAIFMTANLYFGKASYEKCLTLYMQALVFLRKAHGNEDHVDVALLINFMGKLYKQQGRNDLARVRYQQSGEMMRRVHGPIHPNVAHTINNLAVILRQEGKLLEALNMYEEALGIRRQIFSTHLHPDIATTLNNMSVVLDSLGRQDEAIAKAEECLKLRRKIFENEHPDVAVSLNNVAKLYCRQERYIESLAMYESSLEIRRKLCNGDHPDMIQSLNGIAAVYNAQGRHSDAILILKRALAISRDAYGAIHPDIAMSLSNIGASYCRLEDYGSALDMLEEACMIRIKLHGTSAHPEALRHMENIVLVVRNQKDYEGALNVALNVLEIRRILHPKGDPALIKALIAASECYGLLGRDREALRCQQEAIRLRRRLAEGLT